MYIEQRRRRWYALHDIPKDAQEPLGKKRFFASLKTEDRKEAERRAALLEQKWLLQIETARSNSTDAVERDALYWREQFLSAKPEEKHAIEWFISDKADEYRFDAKIMDPEHPDFEDQEEVKDSRRFYGIAMGQLVRTDEKIEEWLATRSSLQEKTINMYRSDLQNFAAAFTYVNDIERRSVTAWYQGRLAEGLKPKTMQRIVGAVRGYWGYLQDIELASAEKDPFESLSTKNKSRRSSDKPRQPFSPSEVSRLLDAAVHKGDDSLADLIRLAMWTGCRIESLCSLKLEHVADDHIQITEDKTNAGRRKVPVHPKLKPALDRLTQSSTDGYVLSNLTANKYGDRSNAIGKRFGNLKRKLGFGPEHVFHSIRKTVITQLEQAGVPENVTADIVGHEKKTITYGLYSGGNSLSTLAEATAKLAYPEKAATR